MKNDTRNLADLDRSLYPWIHMNNESFPESTQSGFWPMINGPTLPSTASAQPPLPLLPLPPPPPPSPPPAPPPPSAPSFSSSLIIIPWSSRGSSSPRRYSHSIPIEFWVGGQRGIRLIDALQGNVAELVDFNNEVMHATSAKVSYRVEWVGYRSLSKQKYAHRTRSPQNRIKIAKQVAEVVSEFVNDRGRQNTLYPEWRIGRGYIEYENLYLVAIKRVSQATWVPVLAYAT